MTDEDEWEVRRLRYRGRFLSSKKQLVHHFIVEDTGEDHVYKAAPKWPVIGAIYEVEFLAGTTRARIEDAKLIDGEDLHPDTSEWRLEDRVAALMKQANDATKRMASNNPDISQLTLQQVRGVMEHQPRHVRMGTLMTIMEYLR